MVHQTGTLATRPLEMRSSSAWPGAASPPLRGRVFFVLEKELQDIGRSPSSAMSGPAVSCMQVRRVMSGGAGAVELEMAAAARRPGRSHITHHTHRQVRRIEVRRIADERNPGGLPGRIGRADCSAVIVSGVTLDSGPAKPDSCVTHAGSIRIWRGSMSA